jgi:precorrin-3B synthase
VTRLRQSDTDACPGALRLHAAADGLLARVRLPGGVLTGAQLRSLRDLAEEFGDGRLELTSRANLQLRALKAEQAETLATRLRTAGLLPSTTHDAVRNIAAPPLADDLVTRLVADLDAAICADPGLAALPGKFLFAIGHVPLAADVAAVPVPPVAVEPGPGAWFALRFGGHDTGLRVSGETVVKALLASAHAFLAER